MKLQEQLQSNEIFLKTGRIRAKNFNFGRNYGAQRRTLAVALGLDPNDLNEVDVFIDRLAEEYPDFERFLSEIQDNAVREGQLVSAYGRIRHFPTSLDERVQAEQGRQGSNFVSQSAAAFAMRSMLVRISRELKNHNLRTQQFNVVYDSNINEHPIEEEKTVARIVATEMLKPVPQLDNHVFGMEMGNGKSWKDAEHNAVKIYDMDDAKKYIASL
jgi:DNA polymerase I-like protein with 3'-5' exonuclease and polymerase domains